MLSYLEYKLINSVPLSSSIYELGKNIGSSSYSITYSLAKKLERMGIIRIEDAESNGRRISRIWPGKAYNMFKNICDNYFNEYYSKATGILKQQIEETARELGLTYKIIGGQNDPNRAYTDIEIAVPETEALKWKKALKGIESGMNYFGMTIETRKEKRLLLRKLHVIPLPFKATDPELKAALENKSIKDVHYGSEYPELAPYFLYLTAGARNG